MRPRRTVLDWHRTQWPCPCIQPIQIRNRQRKMTGENILLEAHATITGPRNASYGPVTEDYAKVIDIFAGLTGIRLSMSDALLFMVSVKMARLRTNLEKNRLHHDSLLDALGYLALLNQAYEELPFPQTVAER